LEEHNTHPKGQNNDNWDGDDPETLHNLFPNR
jgi:hypothetical protein